MMLTLLEPTAAGERLRETLCVAPGSDEGLCAMFRAEIHARGQAPRAATIERVERMVGPLLELETGRLATLCDALVREGDLVRAPGGILWATPLRVVPLPGGVARLFSSVPTPKLAHVLERRPEALGATRSVAWEESMEASVAAFGGRVLSPEVWAGLDRTPLADHAFLEHLDQRLEWESDPPSSLERDGPLDWRGWAPDGDRPGWRRDAPGARLWWARTGLRGHRRAWTRGEGSPAHAAFIELSFDDADRARFSLSRIAGASQALRVELVDGHAMLEVPWLPRPEYRWLSLQAEFAGDAAQAMRWRLPKEALQQVTDMLRQRLGLVVETP
ncbi:MAG: hypothetical protein H6741_33000 [Alphaproteobacteria bacterium]|nr:hypothetical protein [Alphaproteobacteria bacterium]